MNRFILVLFAGIILLAGCSTPTAYHKVVTVEKDGDGKVVKTTVMEEINQPQLKEEAQQPKHLDQ
jgi:uncharacterized lipoprotein YajG